MFLLEHQLALEKLLVIYVLHFVGCCSLEYWSFEMVVLGCFQPIKHELSELFELSGDV